MNNKALFMLMGLPLVGVAIWSWLPNSSDQTLIQQKNTAVQSSIRESSENLEEARVVLGNVVPNKQNTSLTGTDKDGAYPLDDEGNLIISHAIKERFEYFLSTMGEFPLEAVLAMVKDDIQLSLPSPAKEQALQLFEDYIAYKYALAELEKSLEVARDYEVNDIERFRYQLDQLRNKRREYMSNETVDAFFGFDEMYDDFMLARLEVQNNRQLSKQEKSEQLQALEASLPPDVQDMRDQSTRISDAFAVSETMREQGASDSEVFEYRSQMFSQEAAQNLQALDQQRSEWKARVQRYLQLKADIKMDLGLAQEEQQSAILELQQQRFNETELKRLPAYEIIYSQE